MNNEFLKHILRFFLLLVLQILVFNHVYIFGFINPDVYLLALLLLPLTLPKSAQYGIAFATGLIVDIFDLTFGVHALAAMFMIALRPLIIKLLSINKKKMDETKALQLGEIQNKEENMTIAYNPAIPPEIPASDVGEQVVEAKEEVAPSFLSAPSVPNEVKENPITENVPVINPDEIPDTPKEAMPSFNSTENVDVYKNEMAPSLETSTPVPFEMEPDIKPVIPSDTIENIRNINKSIEKDLTDLERVKSANEPAPNVAPVEVIADTLDATPAPAPAAPRPQVFSAVNPPKNNNNIDSL